MTTFWIILGGVGAAAALLGIGIGLGRYSLRDDIDALEDRLDLCDEAIADEIGKGDDRERYIRKLEQDLVREHAVSDHLRDELGQRRIGDRPLWAQLRVPEPLPIDTGSLAWGGSLAGHTGAWSTVAPFTVVDLGADDLVAA